MVPRTDMMQGLQRQQDGGGWRARLRRRSQRGAALVEAAIITPVLFTIIFGAIEYGLMFKDSLTLSNATRAGARIGSIDGNNQYTDYDIVNAVTASLGAANVTNTQYLIIYKATPTVAGGAPLNAPPLDCLNAAALVTTTGGVSGTNGAYCNIYGGGYLATFNSSAKSTFGACPSVSTGPDHFWCPVGTATPGTGRQVLQSTSSTADGGPDYVGVYIKITHKALTGLVTNNKALSDNTVQRIEPH